MKNIPFIDLKTQQARIREAVEARFQTILDHGAYIMGPEVTEAEEKLAEFAGATHCVSCGSGTDALLMALMSLDIGPGDAVFTTPFTFIATAEAIALLGATPIFVDVDEKDFNIDVEKLKSSISTFSKQGLTPKGIIPVDIFGQPADYDSINSLAKEHDLFVIADAAQSFGGEYKGSRVGTLADITTTSFFPAKPLGCYGDGGAVFTENKELKEKLESIRVHGQGIDKYTNVRVGLNGRFDTLQAAVILEKLTIFAEEIELRNTAAARYSSGLEGIVTPPFVHQDRKSAWAQYSVLTERKDEIISSLKEKNIPVATYYPIPLHLQEAFTSLGYKMGDFPISEKLSETIFSLPMHPYLTKEAQDFIISSVSE